MVLTLIGDIALPVFAFYLLVASNFIGNTFGCRLQNVLSTNMIAKHSIAFLLLLFLIVIASPENADKEMFKNIVISIGVYVWFFITTRTPFEVMLIVLILILASYITSISVKRLEKEQKPLEAKKAQRTQNILALIALCTSFVGFAIYVIEKKREYKKKFEWTKFFSGTTSCRNYTPQSARIIRVYR